MSSLNLTPFSVGCGVTVGDLQLAKLTDDELLALREAFAEHGVLFFRDQQFTPHDHLQFAHRWGELVLNKFFKPVEGFPDIAEVRKEKHQTTNIGGGWHTDHSYDDIPAMGSILVARDLPTSGGDTRFANLYAAFDALSPGLQQTLQSLRAIHSNKHIYGKDGFYRTTDIADQLGGVDEVGDATHPVVITHPESGRKALYVNPGHTLGFEGWTRAESQPLLGYLYSHVDQPQFTCQFNWQPGSVVFWDNRSTWHFAQNDYQGQARLMHRITLAGSALAAAV
ncbi:TauD/TfdA dioxygenase family protein [Oceanicoccus sagamiensis]|uniref:Taurine dioxygenase n=1 Tax=Oceanicoccus sagamiensis TaxID=716816 RepID=A0A1X9NBS8_9GAMM|nr:TauD/TfdA family dioxygenase [Oceanicoccus sagamiensis]ARN75056.1 taurine dioxygenase [Oceanicoccus sagamiensis]